MPHKQWLKKYTKLDYLEGILRNRHLHLGNPSDWDDKNDSEGIRLFSAGHSDFKVLSTCLTEAADRFHFWHVFGEREKGVCLWFDKERLIHDIQTDSSLIADSVLYRTPKEVAQLSANQIPFAKREQYRDESEFRVLRVQKASNTPIDKFLFSQDSLRRIYLNPWLSNNEADLAKAWITDTLEDEFGHVEVLQNRTLGSKRWLDAISLVAEQGNDETSKNAVG